MSMIRELLRPWPGYARGPGGAASEVVPMIRRARFVDDMLMDRPIRMMRGRNELRRHAAVLVRGRDPGARATR